ncbi:MAG: DUF2249 domain-containing protein [Halioglobus sp.]|nr:DUF2249 domain-containing protein [Halioglobus sp.]
MPSEVLLDAREMAPPEPFERASALLRELRPGQYLRMLHHRVPYPLFDFCRRLSLICQVIESGSAPCELIVYFAADETALREAAVL